MKAINLAKLKVRALLRISSLWLGTFFPLIGVVGGGTLFYSGAIAETVRSTPHPALVAAIGIVAAITALFQARALYLFDIEQQLARRLCRLSAQEAAAYLRSTHRTSIFEQVYQAVFDILPHTWSERQEKIEAGLHVGEGQLFNILTLPNYLGGALVGLGLVGTFVGLLSALADLGQLFTSMTHATSANGDPVAMFSVMLDKLQAPMKGMGTAFVASLYGLLGSLVLGLVGLLVRSHGVNAVAGVRDLVEMIELPGNADGHAAQDSQEHRVHHTHDAGDLFLRLEQRIDAMTLCMNEIVSELRALGERDDKRSAALHSMFSRLRVMQIRIALGNSRMLATAVICGLIAVGVAQFIALGTVARESQHFRNLEAEHTRNLVSIAKVTSDLTVQITTLNTHLAAFGELADKRSVANGDYRLRVAAHRNEQLAKALVVSARTLSGAAKASDTGLSHELGELSLARSSLVQMVLTLNAKASALEDAKTLHALAEVNTRFLMLESEQNRMLSGMLAEEQHLAIESRKAAGIKRKMAPDAAERVSKLQWAQVRTLQAMRNRVTDLGKDVQTLDANLAETYASVGVH